MPANKLEDVKSLMRDETSREFFKVVQEELRAWGLDDDDLASIVIDDLGEVHWFKSKVTQRYYPGTTSDYYSVWVDECGARMFIKLLISEAEESRRVVVSSFKKDDRYA